MSRYLALDTTPGLADVLAGAPRCPEVLRDSLDGRLTVLPAGHHPVDPGEILASPALGETVAGADRTVRRRAGGRAAAARRRGRRRAEQGHRQRPARGARRPYPRLPTSNGRRTCWNGSAPRSPARSSTRCRASCRPHRRGTAATQIAGLPSGASPGRPPRPRPAPTRGRAAVPTGCPPARPGPGHQRHDRHRPGGHADGEPASRTGGRRRADRPGSSSSPTPTLRRTARRVCPVQRSSDEEQPPGE